MPTPLLFVIHGMGSHPQNWCSKITAQLKDLASTYPSFDKGLLGALPDPVPITYDGLLDKWMLRSAQDANQLRSLMRDQSISVPGSGADNLLGWLSGAAKKEKDFFWESAADVLYWRFSNEVKKSVIASVQNQVIDGIVAAQQQYGEVLPSILAHSLGTSVIHDALAQLAQVPIKGNKVFMEQRFDNLFMVANVSRVLELSYDVYTSPVRPGSNCTRYYNFRHQWDPFPAVKAFKPVGWGDHFVPVEDLEHFLQPNVHALEHYLAHPSVHIPIFRALYGVNITEAQETEALHGFKSTLMLDDAIDGLKSRFNQTLPLLDKSEDPLKFVIMAAQYGGW